MQAFVVDSKNRKKNSLFVYGCFGKPLMKTKLQVNTKIMGVVKQGQGLQTIRAKVEPIKAKEVK